MEIMVNETLGGRFNDVEKINVDFGSYVNVDNSIFLENDELDDNLLNAWEDKYDFENSGTQAWDFGNGFGIYFYSEGDKYCDVHNYVDLDYLESSLVSANCVEVKEINMEPADKYGIKFSIVGRNTKGVDINVDFMLPVYSCQNGYYTSAVSVVLVKNGEWYSRPMDCAGEVEIY